MQTVKITTSQNIEIDYAVAGLGDRIVARVIDYGIFMALYMATVFSFAAYMGIRHSENSAAGATGILIMILVWMGLCVFYDLITEVFFNGQSVGKRAMKIKVISLNGARPSVGQYILRWIFRLIDFGLTFGSLAIVTVAMSDNKQRTGDMVAGTTLVKTTPLTGFNDLVFGEPDEDYMPTYNEVTQLNDEDITLVHDVIKNFNRTRNSALIYKLALRVKAHLNITFPNEINEYQFLEIVVKDYNVLTAR